MPWRFLGASVLTSILAAAAGPAHGQAATPSHELFFEMKLLIRDRVLTRRLAVDQWAGGRLGLTRVRSAERTRFVLDRPLEDPWVFRWYPDSDEVKLGAAVHVDEPDGHPYGNLLPELLPRARSLHAAWWSDDPAAPVTGTGPSWQSEVAGFWSELHATERAAAPPLHADPVYPFHVLGNPEGRFRFETDPRGGVDPASIEQTMDRPWLSDGWDRSRGGESVSGYGFWEAERPTWEPNTYPALAAALQLLCWSPLPQSLGPSELLDGTRHLAPSWGVDLAAAASGVIAALNPRFGKRADWRGDAALSFVVAADGESIVLEGDTAFRPDHPGELSIRVWRRTRFDGAPREMIEDELQLLAVGDNPARIKLWIRVGYRPSSVSGKPSTNERSSSRTRR